MKKQILILATVLIGILMIVISTATSNQNTGTLIEMVNKKDVYHQASEEKTSLNENPNSSTMDSSTENIFFVDIRGEVNTPGVFEANPNYRIIDIVQIAGGLTNNAQELAVNFASRIYDEMVIFIPSIYDNDWQPIKTPSHDHNNTEPNSQQSTLISINTAAAQELQSLPSIGPAISNAIITHRDTIGPFTNIDDLIQVPGIGIGTLEAIRELIEL